MSALPTGEAGSGVLVPHWLGAPQRLELAAAVRAALGSPAVQLGQDVLEVDDGDRVHVAAARDAVWPASAARVRLATGWDADVLPVRLSLAEVTAVLSLCVLPDALRARLAGDGR